MLYIGFMIYHNNSIEYLIRIIIVSPYNNLYDIKTIEKKHYGQKSVASKKSIKCFEILN